MEIWRPVTGYENVYEVSDLGNVRRSLSEKPHDGTYPGRMLRPFNSYGYRRVILCSKNKTKKFFVHRLVAQAFIPNPTNLPIINHLNFDRSDNRISNLEWCTQKRNMQHSIQAGRKRIFGEENVNAKLNNLSVRRIRKLFSTGKHSKSELARQFKVTPSLIREVVLYHIWKLPTT